MSLEPQAGSRPGPPAESQPRIFAIGERSLMDVWRVLSKRRYTIIVVTILSTALAIWHAYSTPQVYETTSSIEIKPSSLNSNSMEL